MITDYLLTVLPVTESVIYILGGLLTFYLGFLGAPLWLWTLWVAAVCLDCGVSQEFWTYYVAIAALLNLSIIRRYVLALPVAKTMKVLKFLPEISDTERVAIEAGNVWVDAELFSGKPNFERCLNEPYPVLTKEEQAFIDGPVEELCKMTTDYEINQKRDLPKNVWTALKKEKFFGVIIPKKYGGLGFSANAHSAIVAKLSSRSCALGITTMVPNSLGPAELLIHYGTKAQKDYYLPRLAEGKEIPCFGLTEPGAGSDAGAIKSHGEVFEDKDGKLYIKLNWNKRWITLSAISTLIGLAFVLRDPDNLLKIGKEPGITCAMIPAKTKGVVLGRRHDPLGVPFFNCPTQGKDVIVPIDAIIGGKSYAGKGWQMLMGCLAAGRGISLPANSTGGAKAVSRVVTSYATVRKQFGLSIGRFEGVEEPMARILGYTYLMEATRAYTCGGLDSGQKPPVITAIAKYNFTEIFRKIINDAMDIVGGAAITKGPRNMLANAYIATPIGITVEGANILTRTLIVFGQGAIRCHPFAKQEIQALETDDWKLFDKAFFGHVGHVIRNVFRSVGLSVTRGLIAKSPVSGPMRPYYKKLAWASASFALLSDIALGSLGGDLKRKEKITGRFADILSWMYISLSIMRRFHADGRKKEDISFAKWGLDYAFYQMQLGFDGLFANMGAVYKPILWWSRLNRFSGGPSDDLGSTLCKLMQTPGEQRDRLTRDIFMPVDEKDPHSLVERTFLAVKAIEPIEKKIKKAIVNRILPKMKGVELVNKALEEGVISHDEAQRVLEAEKMRDEAIQVDSYSVEDYSKGVF